MLKDIVTWAAIFGLGVSGAFGAQKIFATKTELSELRVESRCEDSEYRIDKVTSGMWEIEDRYGGVTNPSKMSPPDARRYRDFLKRLEKWRDWQKKLGCTPKG